MRILLQLCCFSSRWPPLSRQSLRLFCGACARRPPAPAQIPPVRMRKFHSLTPPLACSHGLRGSGGGLSVSRTSFDSVHRLKSGSWAGPVVYWTAREKPGPRANHIAARETVDPGEPVLGSAARHSSFSVMASEKSQDLMVTCTAPVNIAVIKYCECWRQGSARPGSGRRAGGRSHRDWNRGTPGLEEGGVPE